jgi:hypothetical protein
MRTCDEPFTTASVREKIKIFVLQTKVRLRLNFKISISNTDSLVYKLSHKGYNLKY